MQLLFLINVVTLSRVSFPIISYWGSWFYLQSKFYLVYFGPHPLISGEHIYITSGCGFTVQVCLYHLHYLCFIFVFFMRFHYCICIHVVKTWFVRFWSGLESTLSDWPNKKHIGPTCMSLHVICLRIFCICSQKYAEDKTRAKESLELTPPEHMSLTLGNTL